MPNQPETKGPSEVVELAVSWRDPETEELDRVGRIRIIDRERVDFVRSSGAHAESLRRTLDEIRKKDVLELDFEDIAVDDEGTEVLVHKTKFVPKGDPLYPAAVQQELRERRFRCKPVESRGPTS